MDTQWTLTSGDAETVDLMMLNPAGGSDDSGERETPTRWWTLRPDGGAHPWFLLSGLFMVVGCTLLNAAAHARKDELAPVLGVAAVFAVYELAVLGIGVWFARRGRGSGSAQTSREGHQLLGLAVVLLADTTFVYNELSVAAPGLGGAIAAAVFVLAIVKLVVVGRVMGLALGRMAWAVVVAGLGVTLGVALLARAVGGTGRLPDGFGHVVWWGVAALVAAALWAGSDPRQAERAGGLRWLRVLMLAVPSVSAVLHVLAIHWMYMAPLSAAHLSPVLLGISVVLMLRANRSAETARKWAITCGVVGALAAAFSRDVWTPGRGTDFEMVVTPLRLWLVAGALAYALVWWRQRTLGLLAVWPMLGVAAALGHSPAAMLDRVAWLADQAWRVLRWVTPRTLWAWGVSTVVLAFFTLGLGTWVSMRRDTLGPRR